MLLYSLVVDALLVVCNATAVGFPSVYVVVVVVKVVEDDDRDVHVHLKVVDVDGFDIYPSPTQLRYGSFDDCLSMIDADVG